jgi:hypothetical protein
MYEPIARNEAVSVGTSSMELMPVRAAGRSAYTLKNVSTAGQVITVSFGPYVAIAGAGLVMSVGDYFSDSSDSGRPCWQGAAQAVSSAVGGTLAIMEM